MVSGEWWLAVWLAVCGGVGRSTVKITTRVSRRNFSRMQDQGRRWATEWQWGFVSVIGARHAAIGGGLVPVAKGAGEV